MLRRFGTKGAVESTHGWLAFEMFVFDGYDVFNVDGILTFLIQYAKIVDLVGVEVDRVP